MVLRQLIKGIGRLEASAAGLLLGVASLAIGLQLLSRAFMGRALPWPEELSVILFVYLTFLGAGALYKMDEHLRVDYFVARFVPANRVYLVTALVHALCLVAFAALLLGAWQGLQTSMRFTTGAAIPIPRGYLRLPLIFMCLTNILASLVFIWTTLREKPVESIDPVAEILEAAETPRDLPGVFLGDKPASR